MLLLLYLLFPFFFSNVVALDITVQSNTIAGQPSLVMWARKSSDGNGLLVFDLRFINPDNKDLGLALGNIQAPPSTKFGTAQVVFPSPGSYLLVAVSGPHYKWIGESGQVNAFRVTSIPTSTFQPASSGTSSPKPTSTTLPTSTSQPVSSATSSAKPTSTSSGPRRKKNLGAIIGGTLGGVAFLGLVAALIVFLRRRQLEPTKVNRRWTFHRDKMILPPVLDIRPTSPISTEFSSPDDIEQQQGLPYDDIIPTSPVVMMTSTSGLRPLIKSPHRSLSYPLHGDIEQRGLPYDDIIPTTSPVVMMASPRGTRPLPKSPHRSLSFPLLKPHQQDMVVQMEQIRNKMVELEKNPGPTQHIILDDLQKQMNWLKSQF